jgi:light-regulated signal transduction histidine kinase (bacteriophytochrome)
MPGQNGLECIAELHKRLPYMAIIMMTGQGDEMIASEAIKRGASDYMTKRSICAESVQRTLSNALEKITLRRKVDQQQRELENFAQVLAHDLSASIRAVRCFAGFIEKGIREGRTDNIGEDCSRIIRAAEQMAMLLGTLHQYTRLEARVWFGPVDMRDVLSDTLICLAHTIEQRGARVTYNDMPVVTGNAEQLIQLLQNLIANGIKYCEAEIPTVDVGVKKVDEGWQFSVTDNGIGIVEQFHKMVFEPFRRLHGNDNYSGVGLGLAICRKIVERHGGSIWCESAENQGTTFFFTLPAKAKP